MGSPEGFLGELISGFSLWWKSEIVLLEEDPFNIQLWILSLLKQWTHPTSRRIPSMDSGAKSYVARSQLG